MLHFTQNFPNDTPHNHYKIHHNTLSGLHLVQTTDSTLLVALAIDRAVQGDRIRVGSFYRNVFKLPSNSKVQIEPFTRQLFTASVIVVENGNEKFIEIIKGMKYIKKTFTMDGARIAEIECSDHGHSPASYFAYEKDVTRFYLKSGNGRVVGMDGQIKEFEKMVYAPLILHDTMKRFGLEQTHMYLLHANKGMYKQRFLETICQNLRVNHIHFDFIDTDTEEFDTRFRMLESFRPCLISLKNVMLKSNDCMKSLRSLTKNITTQQGIVIVITTDSMDDVGELTKKLGIDRTYYIKQLDIKGIRDIVDTIIGNIPNNLTVNEIDVIADGLKGKTIKEIEVVFSDFVSNKFYESRGGVKKEDKKVFDPKSFDYASFFTNEIDTVEKKIENIDLSYDFMLTFNEFSTMLFNEVYTSKYTAIKKASTTFSDIGGYEDIKRILKESVVWNMTHKALFERIGVRPPKGIILYGPPGCSKTLFARAVAGESKMSFISIKGSELENKWVGETDKSIRNLFTSARERSPCIIFIDEIDSIARKGDNEHHTKTLSAFLTEMDGFTENENIIVIGATNRIEMIDEAFLRPGRIDKKIRIGLPDINARNEIFKIKLGYEIDPVFGSLTEGMSGAEITVICQEAKMMVIRRHIDNETDENLRVTDDDLRKAIELLKDEISTTKGLI